MNFSYNANLTCASLVAVINYLIKFEIGVECINFAGCCISDFGASYIAYYLQQQCKWYVGEITHYPDVSSSVLRELNLTQNYITVTGLNTLLYAIANSMVYPLLEY